MKKVLSAIALLSMLVFLSSAARADVDPCIYVDNVSDLTVSACFTVASIGSGQYTLTVDSIGGLGGFTIKGIDFLGWTGSATLASGPEGESWGTQSGGDVVDGFSPNNWANQIKADPVSNGGVGAVWTFNGDPGTDVVFHIQFSGVNGSCSAFVANGAFRSNPEGSLSGGGVPCTPVPEPATLTLLGTGLLGIAGLVRKRLGKKA